MRASSRLYSLRQRVDLGDLPLASHPRGGRSTSQRTTWRSHSRPGARVARQVVQVAAVSASAPGPDRMYQIPVKVQGGIHQAMLDSRSSQTVIHQSLVRPEALLDASWMRFGCIHGDMRYPLAT